MEEIIEADRWSRILLFRDFILDETKLRGMQVLYATKEITLRDSDLEKSNVYTFAIRDIYNTKCLWLIYVSSIVVDNKTLIHQMYDWNEKEYKLAFKLSFLSMQTTADRATLIDKCKTLQYLKNLWLVCCLEISFHG